MPVGGRGRLLKGRHLRTLAGPRMIVILGVLLPVAWVVLSRLVVPFDGTLHYYEPSYRAGRPGLLLAWASEGSRLTAGDVVFAVDGRPVGNVSGRPDAGLCKGRHRYTIEPRPGAPHGNVCVRVASYPVLETAYRVAPAALLVLTMMVVGAVVFLRRPRLPAAWVLFAVPVLLLTGATSWPFGPQVLDLVRPLGWLPYVVGSTADALLWSVVLHLALVLPQPFPVVRHPRLLLGVYALPFALYAGRLAVELRGASDSLERQFLLLHVSLPAARTMPLVIAAVVLSGLLVTADRRQRRQEAGFLVISGACAAAYLVLGQLPQAFGWPALPQQWVALVFLPFPMALGAAVLRHRLFDVDLVLRRSVVYGTVAVCLAGVFAASLLGVRVVFGSRRELSAVLAAGLTGLAVQPLYVRLRRVVGRRVFGDRVAPHSVAVRLQQIQPMGEPEVVLGRVVDALARSLRLAYAAVEIGATEGGLRAEVGVRDGRPQRLHLVWGHQQLGSLLLRVEPGREQFGESDKHLLDEVTRQVSAVAYALLLTKELERSRRRLVRSREEERRRLRRDLHDGLGPALAAAAMRAEAARDRVQTDPNAAVRTLDSLLAETREALTEVRRLLEDLGPPALDELGLLAAVRARAESLTGQRSRMRVDVSGKGDLDGLSAAVEVAAYRIAVEAVLNASRHSGAAVCTVCLRAGDALSVDVRDDGCGIAEGTPEGVGVSSMRERAAEVGGFCTIESRPGVGTRVHARLPLPSGPAVSQQAGIDVP